MELAATPPRSAAATPPRMAAAATPPLSAASEARASPPFNPSQFATLPGDYVIDGYEGNKNDWHYVTINDANETAPNTWEW